MNPYDAQAIFESHICEYISPSVKNETILIMVSKEKVIHIYSADDDYMFAPAGVRKIYVLEKNTQGQDDPELSTSVRKYDALDIARIIARDGFKISILNSNQSAIEKMISKNMLSHSNTIDPSYDTVCEKMGYAHHDYYFYTHEMIKGLVSVKSQEY